MLMSAIEWAFGFGPVLYTRNPHILEFSFNPLKAGGRKKRKKDTDV